MHTKENKKGLKLPNALIVVFGIMVLAMVLTWIIPAGQYDTLPDSTVLDPATYHRVDQSPVGLWDLASAVFGGMSSAANIIVFTFLVGGYFNVLIESKSVDGFISCLIRKLGTASTVILPVLLFIMHYVKKLQKNPALGLRGAEWDAASEKEEITAEFTFRHVLALLGLIVGLGVSGNRRC